MITHRVDTQPIYDARSGITSAGNPVASREVIFFDTDRDDIDVDGEEACLGFGSHYVNAQPLARKAGFAVTTTEPAFTVGDQVVVEKKGSGVVKFVGSHKVEGEN